MRRILFLAIVGSLFFSACSKKADRKILTDQNILHKNMKQLTEVIIQDMFSPPVSGRIYCYTSLAAYEALKYDKKGYNSLTAQLHGFDPMPVPESNKKYNFLLAATKAFFTVAEKITFSKDSLIQYENNLYPSFESLLDKETFDRSMSFGDSVGKIVLKRAAHDNYKETRGMAKFLGSNDAGKWRPTPADYLDALEPNWGMIKPLAIDSAEEIQCPAPPAFSTDTTSEFFKYMKEVYTITSNLTDSQRTIAKYWDDNPFVIEHSGHLMFGNKKITPVGHWIGITGIACKKTNANAVKTAEAYALTSTAIFDVIDACWKIKYKYNHIRPVTVINELIDRGWQPFLQTPPFPEHSSGHSGISATAATVLTNIFGDNFAFEDTSDLEYIGMKRSFKSFMDAANEASISRVYGGIHYRTGINAGATQGREVGAYVTNKFLKKVSSKN
jgi:hypothetical protein